jgi:hypothetical protein
MTRSWVRGNVIDEFEKRTWRDGRGGPILPRIRDAGTANIAGELLEGDEVSRSTCEG